jgi:hypothetical protein
MGTPKKHDANWWREECNYISRVMDRGGRVKEMNNSPATFRRYCEMQRDAAERDGVFDAATYIQEIIDDLPASRSENPLTRVKIMSPPQRPAGTRAKPGKRLVARRKKTAKAPEGFYANPLVKGESNSNAARYAELYGGAPDTIRAWRDHYIVRFHKPGEKSWSMVSVFKKKADAVQYARAYARANPAFTVSVINKE